MPILLGRPLVVEPVDDDPEALEKPHEDVGEDASSLLEWTDEVLEKAIDFLEPISNRAAA